MKLVLMDETRIADAEHNIDLMNKFKSDGVNVPVTQKNSSILNDTNTPVKQRIQGTEVVLDEAGTSSMIQSPDFPVEPNFLKNRPSEDFKTIVKTPEATNNPVSPKIAFDFSG